MLSILGFVAVAYAHPEQLVDTYVGRCARRRPERPRSWTCGRAGMTPATCPVPWISSPVAIRDAKNPPTFLPSPQAFA